MNPARDVFEVRIHGRGGQGMVTASFILASAFVEEGMHVQAFPEFGPERRGAPVKAYLRFSEKYIFRREPVLNPDVVMVADESLLKLDEVFAGIKNGKSIMVLNLSTKHAEDRIRFLREKLGMNVRIFWVPASEIAFEVLRRNIVNTAMVGAFIKAVGKPSLESVERIIGRFVKDPERNIKVMKTAYEKTKEWISE